MQLLAEAVQARERGVVVGPGGADGDAQGRGVTPVASSKAIALRATFPEAWNELGYALRNRGRYPDSLAAYEEALRLRPDFPEALEYLGEAYVKMGRLADAARVLDRLRPLDPQRAEELAVVIKKGK